MSLLFTNNAVSTLASGISAGAGSLTVQAADGNLFPNPTGNDEFLVTLEDASNNIEIVKCTSRSGDVLTIERAQEGTTAQAWLVGDSVELRVTAGVLSQYRQGVGDGVTSTAINLALGAGNIHDFIECTAALTITLADASTMGEGYQVTIKNNSSGVVTIDRATGTDTIDNLVQDISIGPGGTAYLSVNANENGYMSMFREVEAAYPVGAIWMSTENDDPATILGFGTWTQILGRFLVGVGDNGDGKTYAALEEGGQKNAIIPNHTHPINDPGHDHNLSGGGNDDDGGPRPPGGNNTGSMNSAIANATTGINVTQGATGGESVTNKNLPPYFAVYMWRRTA